MRSLRVRELAAALGCLAAVAAFLLPHAMRERRREQEASAEATLRSAWKAEQAHRTRTGRYAGNLAALADAGLLPREMATGLKGGYRFGLVGLDERGAPLDPLKRFAYYAVPEAYGDTGTATMIVDAAGLVYARDSGEGAPPAAWPADDPAAAGWKILGQ